MRNNLALVPVFFGDSHAAHSSKDSRLNDLLLTIISIKENFDVKIGVCCSDDYEKIPDQLKDDTVDLKCNPLFIPSELTEYCKINHSSYDHYLLTEADQFFVTKDWRHIEKNLKDDEYISPHRLEKLYKNVGINRGYLIHLNGVSYVCPNSKKSADDDGFHKVDNWVDSFGGSFFCNRETFMKIKFSKSEELIIEHQTGLDLFNMFECKKTNNILNFFVYHLSGYEYHKKIHDEHILLRQS